MTEMTRGGGYSPCVIDFLGQTCGVWKVEGGHC
jgi:hypothetical protein